MTLLFSLGLSIIFIYGSIALMIKKPFQLPYLGYHIFKAANKIIIDNILGRSFEDKYEHVFKFGRKMIDAFDIDIQFSGLENYIEEPAIICQNHTSVIDFPVLLHENIPGRKYFGAKIPLFKRLRYPFFRHAMSDLGMIKIDRDDPASAYKCLYKGADMVKRECIGTKEKAYLIMYPEKTRSKLPDYEMLPFRPGAFKVGKFKHLPIIPLVTIGAKELMPKRSLEVKAGTVYMRVCEPLYPQDYLNWEEVQAETRKRMEAGIEHLKIMRKKYERIKTLEQAMN